MASMSLDLHKREGQLAIKANDGTITNHRIATSRERFTALLGGRSHTKALVRGARSLGLAPALPRLSPF